MTDILTGTSIVAAFLGGAVALFAPCCISVMLPAYFATSFRRRRALVSMTLVFALGIATVILPIAFGVSSITRVILGRHTLVYMAGATLMVTLGVVTLAGRRLPLPRLGMQARPDRGPGAVFALGAFSGVASACCAPVLAGVVALSGAASSFVAALLVGVAYVFGMVLPLFVIALLWDRYDWGHSGWLRGRQVTMRVGARTGTIHSSALTSGLIMIVMGALVAMLAITGPAMATGGWQASLTADLQHYSSVVLDWLDAVPGWLSGLVVLVILGWVVRRAVAQHLDEITADESSIPPPAASTGAVAHAISPAGGPDAPEQGER